MFENIIKFFKNIGKKEENRKAQESSKDAAKERLHLVLMQDRANVSADFLDLMKQEIIEVIKKYIDIDESAMDVRLTNKENGDGINGAPALYANIPIINIKDEVIQTAQVKKNQQVKQDKQEDKKQDNKKQENNKQQNNKSQKNKKQETKKQDNKENERKEQKQSEDKKEQANESKNKTNVE